MAYGSVWSVLGSTEALESIYPLCDPSPWTNGRILSWKKMKVGGNRNARIFFESQPDYDDSLSIQQKYNTKAAALYRDKISALAQGKRWEEAKSPAQNYSASGNLGASISSSNSCSSYQTDSYQSNGYQSNDLYQNINSAEFKNEKEAYFSKLQNENAQRRDDLPPSQGGKYSGFGFTKEPPPRSQSQELIDNTLTSLVHGWSFLSNSATKIVNKASENAIKYGGIASQKVVEVGSHVTDKAREGSLLEDVSGQVSNLATKVTDFGKRGWNQVSGMQVPTGDSSAYGQVGGDNAHSPGEKSSLFNGFNNQQAQDDWSFTSQQGSKASSPKSPGPQWGYQSDGLGYQSDLSYESKSPSVVSATSPTAEAQKTKKGEKKKSSRDGEKKWDNKWGDDELWESLNN